MSDQPKVAGPDDPDYFESYAHLAVHRTMLQDRRRTLAYKNAILGSKEEFAGKVVLDIGCGTGILSHFCVQAGARKVYAVDASNIADQAKLIAEENGVADKLVVIKGRIEEIELPEQVDIIVSEWMGHCLLYESMFDSVIVARDKWLRKDTGFLFPSHASMFMAPFNEEDYYHEHVDYWNDVYGVKMTSVIPLAEKCFFREAEVAEIDACHLLGQDLLLKSFDLMTVTGEELREFSVPFSFLSYQINELTGFCIWFDVKFETRQMTESIKSGRTDVRPVVLSTSPYEEPTHWMQTLLHIPATVSLFQDDPITGTIVVRSNPIHVNRKMLFSLSLDLYSFEEKPVKEEDKAEIMKLMKKGRQNKYAALGKLDERIARWTVEMKVGKKGKKQAALNTKYNWTPGGVSKKEIEPPPALTTKCGSLQFDFELE